MLLVSCRVSFRDCTHLFLITVRTSCPLHGQQLLVVPHCLLVLLIVLVPEEEAAIHTYVRTNSYVVEQIYSIPGAYLLYTINPSFPPPPPPTVTVGNLSIGTQFYLCGRDCRQCPHYTGVAYSECPL